MVRISAADKQFKDAVTIKDDDGSLSQKGKPAGAVMPYGVFKFEIINLTIGEEVTLTLTLPENAPETSAYYKITSAGWSQIPLGSNNGDNVVTITLKDGDPATDADGFANGIIVDPGALVTGIKAGTIQNTGSDDSDFFGCKIRIKY